MIITIDGPAGSGKSTVAKQLAALLGYDYLDTGAMYRSIALLGLRNHVDWNRPDELLALAQTATLDAKAGRNYLNGEDITDSVRSLEVTQLTKYAANNPDIRKILVSAQRNIAKRTLDEGGGIITEGRDQGSEVFPFAEYRFFLTASPEERANRRFGELKQRGENAELAELLQQINQRDAQDRAREVGPLREPEGGVVISTDGMSVPEVVEALKKQIKK